MRQIKSIIAVLALCAPLTAFAEGLPIDPGLWRITSTMEMPMLPQPRVDTVEQCMEEDVLSPETMNPNDEELECTFDWSVDGNTMTWSVDCPMEGGTSRGEWEATSGGDTVTGNGVINMEMAGQAMQMTMSWEGERIGDCP